MPTKEHAVGTAAILDVFFHLPRSFLEKGVFFRTLGTVNELVMLGILARINVSYINDADQDSSKWVITDVYNANTLGILNDPIYEGKSIIVLFHSINHVGSGANHYKAIYMVQ